MGKDLLVIEPFRASIESCAAAVRPLGVDVMAMILDGQESIWNNTMHCMVCITAIQVRAILGKL